MSSKTRTLLLTAGILAGLAASYTVGVSTARQPAMRNALENLQQARTNLNNAATDKAGHRVEALRLVNLAIDQVQAGIVAGAN